MDNNILIQEAIKVLNPKTINDADMWWVACALSTDKGNIFKWVCIDTISWMWFCAEHTAISQMITQWEYKINKIVAIWKNDKGDVYILPPCWRCREFMYQTNKENINTDVLIAKDKIIKLKELLPYYDLCQKVDM